MDFKNTVVTGQKLRGADKMSRIPVKIIPTEQLPKKPEWIRAKISDPEEVQRIKQLLRQQKLHTVCEEAACPNLPQCFGGGTATFMILGAICTRRCPFCDVAHGRPVTPDANEPQKLAQTIADMALRYVVVTSVDRDDLRIPRRFRRRNGHRHPQHEGADPPAPRRHPHPDRPLLHQLADHGEGQHPAADHPHAALPPQQRGAAALVGVRRRVRAGARRRHAHPQLVPVQRNGPRNAGHRGQRGHGPGFRHQQ